MVFIPRQIVLGAAEAEVVAVKQVSGIVNSQIFYASIYSISM